MTEFAQDIVEMMQAWEVITAAAAEQFPSASAEELYQIALAAMKYQLKA